MKNRLRLPMLTATALLLCFMFLTSCSKDDGPSKKEEEAKTLVLTLSRTEIKKRETVQFTVTAEGTVVDNATIYIDGTAITGYEHTFDQAGSFKAVAKKTGHQDSDQQSIVVLERQMQTVVHVVGTEENSSGIRVGKYWKNGVPTILGSNADPTSLEIADNDVHVLGIALSDKELVYWKNGMEVNRIENASASVGKSIIVSGNDVYLVGHQYNSQSIPVATYWKNGQAVALTDNPLGSLASSLIVSGNTVYAAGVEVIGQSGELVVTHWKNGETIPLKNIRAYASIMPVIAFGEDIYFARTEENADGVFITTCWKNDQEVFSVTTGSNEAQMVSLFVSGTDVYMGGFEFVNGKEVAKYWKNGQVVTLTDGSFSAMVTALYVLGEDVYAAGVEESVNNETVAKYWKNGVAVDLTDGENTAVAYDIIVQEVEIE